LGAAVDWGCKREGLFGAVAARWGGGGGRCWRGLVVGGGPPSRPWPILTPPSTVLGGKVPLRCAFLW